MNWSSPSLQPLGAQPGALDSQFIFYTPPPQVEASSSSGPGLLCHQEDAEGDQDGTPDAEGELQSANRHRRRRAVGEFRPRRRNHGELRQLVEGRDCDLTHLWEPSLRPRDHLPPPEMVYESFEHAVAGVTAWAKDHGLAYKKQKWARGGRYRLLMCCSRSGKCRERLDASDSQPRRGAVSQRTDCKMQFWLMAVDYTQLDGQWRVKWCENRASITHNHPPAHDVGSIAMYKRVTHSNNNELPGDVMSEEITITGFRTRDVRFPTSLDKTGSDAMNTACDYSSAYCILETNSSFSGHGMVSALPCLFSVFTNLLFTVAFFLWPLSEHNGPPMVFRLPLLDIYHRARQRHCLRSHPPHRRASSRQDALFARRQLGPDMALPRVRQPVAVDRS